MTMRVLTLFGLVTKECWLWQPERVIDGMNESLGTQGRVPSHYECPAPVVCGMKEPHYHLYMNDGPKE